LLKTVTKLQRKTEEAYTPERILGQSPPILHLRELLLKVAGSDSTVLITGESGTGKELAAKVLHYQSRRRNGPFVAVNCAAIPETLLEAELFGHEKGAFTGAHQQRIGRFESADNGTVFLDEIGDMPASMQTKILRVLQERTFERVGGVKPLHMDIRLIAATHRDLSQAVAEGKFRADLYYRLNVVPVPIPPLRERSEDIPILAEFFLQKCKDSLGLVRKRLSSGAEARLEEYRWPGNVRELDNIIQRAVLLSAGEEITESEMTGILGAGATKDFEHLIESALFNDPEKRAAISLQDTVGEITEQIEKQIIQKALEAQGGKRQETADMLKISRKSLHNKMKKYGIE
jgi:transcriptional regulator with GAF, ATPase, and Fis domain